MMNPPESFGGNRLRRVACCLGLALLGAATMAAGGGAQRARTSNHSPLDESRQVLIVVTDGWDSVSGTLRRYERGTPSDQWRPVGSPVAVVVGKNGLAWGRGLQSETGDGPIKKEGDGKAPAGAFRLAQVFGQSPDPPPHLAMPYLFLGQNMECVDDVRSTHYNRLVTRQQVDRADWTSSEKMWAEPLYKWGVVVEHNGTPAPPPTLESRSSRRGRGGTTRPEPRSEPATRGAGSCIFLHIWRGPTSGTAGCTAMPEPALLETIQWLDEEDNPLVVQLPRGQYDRLKSVWRLP